MCVSIENSSNKEETEPVGSTRFDAGSRPFEWTTFLHGLPRLIDCIKPAGCSTGTYLPVPPNARHGHGVVGNKPLTSDWELRAYILQDSTILILATTDVLLQTFVKYLA